MTCVQVAPADSSTFETRQLPSFLSATRWHVVKDLFRALHCPVQLVSTSYLLFCTVQKKRGDDFWTEQKKSGDDFWLTAALQVWLRMTVQKNRGEDISVGLGELEELEMVSRQVGS